jgi:hypothetical protein
MPCSRITTGAMAVPEPDDAAQAFPEFDRGAGRRFIFWLLKLRDGEKIRRDRHQLEVNGRERERERERLARRDAYDWDVQRRGKKRKQG